MSTVGTARLMWDRLSEEERDFATKHILSTMDAETAWSAIEAGIREAAEQERIHQARRANGQPAPDAPRERKPRRTKAEMAAARAAEQGKPADPLGLQPLMNGQPPASPNPFLQPLASVVPQAAPSE